jgi:membrane-bound metal-dependent hydrolase YbcI (DUF457 family)
MFVGHLAAALAAKPAEPRVPLGVAVAAAFGLDLLWPLLLLLGVESVRVNPGDTAFTNLAFDSYPWSHSLLLVLVWAALAGWMAWRGLLTVRAGIVVGALVVSHWVLDALTHRPDLPLWPGGPRVGLGLWYSIPATIVLEGTLLAVGVWLYLRATSPRDRVGRWALAGMIVLATVIWITQPWSPPPPSATAVALGAMALWLFPPWAHWIERHRAPRSPVRPGRAS